MIVATENWTALCYPMTNARRSFPRMTYETSDLTDFNKTATFHRMFRVVGMIVFSFMVATSAYADGQDAKALFERATVQFRLGQFHDAAVTYQRVFELHHDPVLLYNCAQSFRLGGEPEKALLFYKSFLSSKPDASNRDEVEGRIAELTAIVADQKKASERPTNDVTPTVPLPKVDSSPTPKAVIESPAAIPNVAENSDFSRRGRTKKIVGVALLSVAVASVVGGVVSAVLSGKASDSINASAKANEPFDPSQQSVGKMDTIISGVMFGVAGAAAAAGAVLLGLGLHEAHAVDTKISIAPALSTKSAGASVSLRF